MNAKYFLAALLFFLAQEAGRAQAVLTEQQDRWTITPDSSIEWKVDGRLPHHDHIEMSGEKVSVWVQYGVDTAGMPEISRTVVFPTFRTKPNDTHGSLMYTFTDADLPRFYINNDPLRADIINGRKRENFPQRVQRIRQKGIMRVESDLGAPSQMRLEHSLFPSVNKPLVLETFVFTNTSQKQMSVTLDYLKKEIHTDTSKSTGGPHTILMETLQYGNHVLEPNGSVSFVIGYMASHTSSFGEIQPGREEAARKKRVRDIQNLLLLETPDSILNTAFSFAKIRATESIYKTKGGYMHSPGGLSYYAAIWANDQAEYINPFFALLGDATATLSAMNAYRLFASYMNPGYKPIPSSIVAEGESFWNGAGDRGDMAMIAYGAARFALTYGDGDSAAVLWPLIEWCLEYCRRKVNADGVVDSDTDELERRFPSGKANLSTSSLYYDALRSASMLAQQLGKPAAVSAGYLARAKTMKANIEKYFGATVEGFATYRYYDGNDVLRSWICLPLTMQIFDRKEGTIDALFSSRLWTADGLATQAGDRTFWDRSTLYALRGVLQAGEVEKAMRFLRYYSRRRLLGEHVPYPVEAYPEGNQRHLSAESGLYCRIYTEGLFGIRPTGLRSFECTPRLPQQWDKMALRNIHAFGRMFDLEIKRAGNNKLSVTVKDGSKVQTWQIAEGATLTVKLPAERYVRQQARPGYTAVFNGTDLDGWVIHGAGKWYVDSEGLVAESRPGSKSGYLRLNKNYKNFTLLLQFKQEHTGNSGVFFNSTIKGKTITGWKAAIAPTAHQTGGVYELNGRGWLALPKPEDEKYLKPGWNDYHIRVINGEVWTWINGHELVHFVDEKIAQSNGSITLQLQEASQDRSTKMRWRDIQIKEEK